MGIKCGKLGSRATKKERYEAHRAKQQLKQALRGNVTPDYDSGWIYANLSKNHEFYGDTPSEHEKRKLGTLENNS